MKKKHNIFFILKEMIKINPIYFVFGIIISIFIGAQQFIIPIGIKFILESAFKNNFKEVAIICFVVSGLFLLISLLNTWFQKYFTAMYRLKVASIYNKRNFNKMRSLSMKNFDDPDFENSCLWATSEAEGRVSFLTSAIFTSLTSLTIVGFAVYSLNFDIILILISVIATIALIIGNFINGKVNHQLQNDTIGHKRYFDYFKRVYSLPEYLKQNRISKSVHLLKENYFDTLGDFKKVNIQSGKKRILITLATSFIGPLSLIISMIRIVSLIRGGTLSVADFVLLVNSVALLENNCYQFLNLLPQIYESNLFVQRLYQFLDTKPDIVESLNPIEFNGKDYNIVFSNVSFSYQDKKVFDNLSLSIKNKEHIALVGANGVGKTTLIKLLLRLYNPTSGQIFLNGKPLSGYSQTSIKNNIGVLLQESQLYALSIYENIFGNHINEKDNAKVLLELMKKLDLEKLYYKYDFSKTYSKEFDSDGVILSKGEQQKILIAKAIYQNSNMLILDEPSSALDPFEEYSLNKRLLEIAGDKTVVLISHRLAITKDVDRIIFLEDGKVAESGTHQELMKLNKKYATFYRLQSEKFQEEGEVAYA